MMLESWFVSGDATTARRPATLFRMGTFAKILVGLLGLLVWIGVYELGGWWGVAVLVPLAVFLLLRMGRPRLKGTDRRNGPGD
jgi:hypothetical protein